jgi:23S rRNA (uracil1939-C5)-methyltransferase
VRNISFVAEDAGEYLSRLAATGDPSGKKPDVLFMDPPRSGASESFLRAAALARPSRIVYISCNPETLVRDLKTLTASGYHVEGAQAFDMFPFTRHVESIALLERVSNRKADAKVHIDVDLEDYYRIKDAQGKDGK